MIKIDKTREDKLQVLLNKTWLVDVQIILPNFHRVLMIDGLKFSMYHVAQEFHVTKSF